jgi:hypothetical protein
MGSRRFRFRPHHAFGAGGIDMVSGERHYYRSPQIRLVFEN